MHYRIISGLSLTSSTDFQIDSLFMTPSYAIVLECKNLAGSIKVKNNPSQLIQTFDNGRIRAFESPITQVQSNMELLRDWFHTRNISLPIHGAIVLAFPKKDVELCNTEIQFLYPSGIPSYIRNLPTTPQLLDEKTFSLLISDLIQSDKEYIPQPICSIYSIQKSEISPGVFCSSCSFLGMIKYQGGWRCPMCSQRNLHAHNQAIRDWFLLFGEKMTNKDLSRISEHRTTTNSYSYFTEYEFAHRRRKTQSHVHDQYF